MSLFLTPGDQSSDVGEGCASREVNARNARQTDSCRLVEGWVKPAGGVIRSYLLVRGRIVSLVVDRGVLTASPWSVVVAGQSVGCRNFTRTLPKFPSRDGKFVSSELVH
jgi:hypothetical protein